MRRQGHASARIIVGLMSGTSLDGVDASLVRVEGHGLETKCQLLAFETYPYPPTLRQRILQACDPEKSDVRLICELNFELGWVMAEAVKRLVSSSGHMLDRIDLIGSHGQTIYHQPPSASTGEPSTLQIGEPAVIAQETGVTTVADFRVADVAVGGEGAPLVPYVDFLLFRRPGHIRCVQNLGGIGNVTYLPQRAEEVIAFDTGPGNMLIDAAMRHFRGEAFDRDGAFAARGTVNGALLRRLMSHPFIRQKLPRSSGREQFGQAFLRDLLQWDEVQSLAAEEIVATLTAFTAESLYESYRRFLPTWPDEILLSGGGAHNSTLRKMIAERMPGTPLRLIDELGIPADAKEAMAFAILANETILGHPTNLPKVTGACRPVLLGKIVPVKAADGG